MKPLILIIIAFFALKTHSCDKQVKVISMNIAQGAGRCFKNPGCTENCGNNCSNTACVKPLLKLESSIDLLVDFYDEQFSDGDRGIICLQEVNTNLSGRNILQEMVIRLGAGWEYQFHSPNNNNYGLAIVSNIAHTKEQFWDLPEPPGEEKRGAIALKFTYGLKWCWVVNTHFGLEDHFQIQQANKVMINYQTFDPDVPVLIMGDFNVKDIHNYGSNRAPTTAEIQNYNSTIQNMRNTGLYQVPYHADENRPYSFHSWNGLNNGQVIDYIFWFGPKNVRPTARALRPGPHQANRSNALCPSHLPDNRYISDHNGVVTEFDVFDL